MCGTSAIAAEGFLACSAGTAAKGLAPRLNEALPGVAQVRLEQAVDLRFDGPSTVNFDPSMPMVSLDLSRIHGSDQLVAMVMTCASAWMESALADPAPGQRWVIYDEAWRMIRQPGLLARMQSQWKLSRGLGIANLMVIHRLSDLDAVGNADSEARALAQGLLADCSTKIIYQQETSEAPHTASLIGLSSAERAQLPDLQVGEGLWRVAQRAFVVRHVLTDRETRLFDTNSRMFRQPVARDRVPGAERPASTILGTTRPGLTASEHGYTAPSPR